MILRWYSNRCPDEQTTYQPKYGIATLQNASCLVSRETTATGCNFFQLVSHSKTEIFQSSQNPCLLDCKSSESDLDVKDSRTLQVHVRKLWSTLVVLLDQYYESGWSTRVRE